MMIGKPNNTRRTSQSARTALVCAALAALVLLSAPTWAAGKHGSPPPPASAPQSFSDVPPPSGANTAIPAPKVPIGDAGGGFSDPPPNAAGNTKPGPDETGSDDGADGPLTLEIRKGDLEIDLTIPGNQQKQTARPAPGTSGKKDTLLQKQQERALNQRNAGKKAAKRLKEAQEGTQTAFEKTADNVGRMNDMLKTLGAGPGGPDVDTSAVDLGESDTLGELN